MENCEHRAIFEHIIKSRRRRKNLTNLSRISTHKLEIEVGRYSRPPTKAEERFCKICDTKNVEDEKHFLLECKIYDNIRNKFLTQIREKFPFISNLENLELFNWLMIFQNDFTCNLLTNFINEAFKIRNTIVNSHGSIYGKRKGNKLNPPKNRIKRQKIALRT